MDVQVLAPALFGFGELVREANAQVNKDKSTVKLVVDADFEHKCFQIRFKVIQRILEKLKDLVGAGEVRAPEDIMQLLGVAALAAGGIGLLTYLARRNGRPAVKIQDEDKRGMVSVAIGEGANVEKVEIHNHVYNMGENKKILNAVANAVRPIKDGGEFDRVQFRAGDRPLATIERADAEKIGRTCDAGTKPPELPAPTPIEAHLTIRGPVFDPKATSWSFWYGDQQITADISETDIAEQAMKRGGAAVGDAYRVMLLISQHYTPSMQVRTNYKIAEVLGFVPYEPPVNLFSWSPPETPN